MIVHLSTGKLRFCLTIKRQRDNFNRDSLFHGKSIPRKTAILSNLLSLNYNETVRRKSKCYTSSWSYIVHILLLARNVLYVWNFPINVEALDRLRYISQTGSKYVGRVIYIYIYVCKEKKKKKGKIKKRERKERTPRTEDVAKITRQDYARSLWKLNGKWETRSQCKRQR